MGRKLVRVPLNFNHPLNKVWDGYLNPHHEKRQACAACAGDGGSPAYRLLHALWYRHLHSDARRMLGESSFPAPLIRFALAVLDNAAFERGGNGTHGGWGFHLDQGDVDALVKANRLWDFTRRPLNPEQATFPNGWTKGPNGYHPTADEVNVWATRGFGHDSINAWVCVRERCRRYRVSPLCASCRGRGYVADRALSVKIARWAPTEPPTGDGYQIWETVSEGSPISPVFARPEDLARWMVEHDTSVTRDTGCGGWMHFILSDGWALTAGSVNGHVTSGVAFVASHAP